jgi:glutaredoxin
MLKICLSVLFIIFLVQGIAIADFYKWEDENGNIQITDYPPPTKLVKNMQVHKYESDSSEDFVSAKESKKDAPKRISSKDSNIKSTPNHDIVLYTTSWCPSCKKARNFFISRNIFFTEYDVEKDKDAAQMFKQLNSRGGVPFAIINGQSILGYSESAYESALQKNQ